MSKRIYTNSLLAALLLGSSLGAAAAPCQIADAQVTRVWTEDYGFRQFAQVHVLLGEAPPQPVEVEVELRFRFGGRDGWRNNSHATVRQRIDPTRQRFANLIGKTLNNPCKESYVCRIEAVEVVEARCQ